MGQILHKFTNPHNDGADTTLVRPSDWNSSHQYTLQDAVSLLGSNTAGTPAAISSGTLYLSGGSNITLFQSGNTVEFDGKGFTQSAQTQNCVDLSVGGNSTSAGAGFALISSGTAILAGGNNITLSQDGQGVTFSGPNTVAQTIQTQGLWDITLGGNSTSGGAGYGLISSGTLTLAGGSNITLSQDGNAVTIEAGGGSDTQTAISGISVSNTVYTSGTVAFSGVGGGVTVSSNAGQRVDISVAAPVAQTVQTQNIHYVTIGGNSTSAGAGYALISSGTWTLAGGNNITLSQNGNALTISGPNAAGAQTGVSSIIAVGGTQTAGALSFADSNGLAFGMATGAVTGVLTGSYTVPVVTNSSWTVSDAATSLTIGQLAFTNSNGLTLSLSTATGGKATLIGSYTVPSQTVQTQNCVDLSLSGNTAGTLALISSGTAILAGGNNITLSQNGQSVTISGASLPATSSLAQSGGVILSTNGSTITVSAPIFTLAGNTAGTLTVLSSGLITLAGGSNITLSQNGNAVSIIGPAAATGGGVAAQIGSIEGGATSGTSIVISTGTMTLQAGNNITLSQASDNAIVISGPNTSSQTVQTQNCVDVTLSGNTSGTLALISSGTMNLAGGNNITLSQSANKVTIVGPNTVAQSVQTQNCVDLSLAGNTSGALVLVSSGTMTLAGGNNITLSQSGNAVTISGPNAAGAQTGISGVVASDATYTSGTVTFSGVGGGVTIKSNTGQRVDISVAAPVAQTVQTQNCVDLSLAGNTSGTLALISSGTAILAGGNNVTLSQNGQSVTISAFNQSAQTQNLFDLKIDQSGGATTGTTVLISSGTATLYAGSNITLSQAAGNALTIIGAASGTGGGGGINVQIGSNTSGTTALISSGTLTLYGGNGITLNQSGNAITISGGDVILSQWHARPFGSAASNSNLSNKTIYFDPFDLPQYLNAYRINFFYSIATTTSNVNSSGSWGYTFSAALYAKDTGTNTTQLTSFWSGSWYVNATQSSGTVIAITQPMGISNSTAVSTSQKALTNVAATTYLANSVAGFRMIPMPISSTLTPGRYWLAAAINSTTANSIFNLGVNVLQSVAAGIGVDYQPMGTSSSQSAGGLYPNDEGLGTLSVTSANFPGTVVLSADVQQGGSVIRLLYNFSGYTTATNML